MHLDDESEVVRELQVRMELVLYAFSGTEGSSTHKSTGDVHAYLAVPDHSGQAVESMPAVTPTSGSKSPRKLQFQRFLNWRPTKN